MKLIVFILLLVTVSLVYPLSVEDLMNRAKVLIDNLRAAEKQLEAAGLNEQSDELQSARNQVEIVVIQLNNTSLNISEPLSISEGKVEAYEAMVQNLIMRRLSEIPKVTNESLVREIKELDAYITGAINVFNAYNRTISEQLVSAKQNKGVPELVLQMLHNVTAEELFRVRNAFVQIRSQFESDIYKFIIESAVVHTESL